MQERMGNQMKKWKSRLALALAVVLLIPVLAGCGRKELDGVKVVEAYLKAQTKGEFDDYAKLTGTDEKKLKKEYERTLDEMTEIFEEVEIFDVDFGENFRKEIKNILSTVKYDVVSSQKDEDDNYVVDVDVYPSDIFGLMFAKVMEAAKTTEDTAELGDMMLQAFRDAVEEQSYGDAVRFQIHIIYNEDAKQYEISQEDTEELAMSFYDLEGAMENLLAPSGTVYDNPYFNWTVTEWNAAPEEEKTQCCLAIIQDAWGLSDEDIAGIDINDPEIQAAIQQMKDGIDISYSGGANISIGDYVELIKSGM